MNAALLLFLISAPQSAEEKVLDLIRRDAPYSRVAPGLFEELGWDLPDGGGAVKRLADAAPGGAFDPAALESLPASEIGYRARWHALRYPYYGLEWDITGLHLAPRRPEADLPTVVFINGGSANLYEFFLDPLNNPGLGQYLAQKVPVLLVTIPGNYKPGGWVAPYAERKPAYLLDRELDDEENAVRNAVFTFSLISEGVARLIEKTTRGPVLIAGHSTGGEIQFLLRDRLESRLRGLSLGWGTGAPARLRRQWDLERGAGRGRYPPIARVRDRSPQGYVNNYVGPLNPVPGGSDLEVARNWFQREERRRPQFKQPLQDLEHRGEIDERRSVEEQIRSLAAASRLQVDWDQAIADLFSTMQSGLGGYRRMIWTVAARDRGHWHPDPEQARELNIANEFRRRNPNARIRVLVFDLPMTHYGHIEKPRQLAGGILAAVRWLVE